jgi:hypothetical protein
MADQTMPIGRPHGCRWWPAMRERRVRRARSALRSLPRRLGRQVNDQATAISPAWKIVFALTRPSGLSKTPAAPAN